MCNVDGCTEKSRSGGFCQKHYVRFKKTGTTDLIKVKRICSVEGCGEEHAGRGFCTMHYNRWRVYGTPIPTKMKGRLLTEDHPRWKAGSITYKGLHLWINERLGKEKLCQHCKTTSAKRFDWANLSGTYQRDFDDWIRLCRSCHIKMDKVLRGKYIPHFSPTLRSTSGIRGIHLDKKGRWKSSLCINGIKIGRVFRMKNRAIFHNRIARIIGLYFMPSLWRIPLRLRTSL